MSSLRCHRFGSVLLAALLASTARAERTNDAPPAPDELGEESADAIDDAALLDALAMTVRSAHSERPARRFSNGPRAVPRARGAALSRAKMLGIGDHLSTKHLLWSRPSKELLAATRGHVPESLLWPVVGGKWGRGFGFTRKVRVELRHNGIDIGAPLGTPVRAAADGLVVYSDNTLHDLGNAVMILHPGGFTTLYAHNLRTTVQPGYYVKRGERIALVGQTGAAWGPHLHFELRDNGRWRDPEPLIVGYRDLELTGPVVDLSRTAVASADERADEHAKERASQPASASANAAPREDLAAATEAEGAPALPLPTGTLAAAQRLLRESPPAVADETQLGRRFRNLLFPVKGGREQVAFEAARHRAVDLEAELGAPVRASADGVVVYSGEELGRFGRTIVLWHRDGWVTVYGCMGAEGAAEAGSRVLRGEWIGRVGTGEASSRPHLHFEWIEHGERRDPSQQFVGH